MRPSCFQFQQESHILLFLNTCVIILYFFFIFSSHPYCFVVLVSIANILFYRESNTEEELDGCASVTHSCLYHPHQSHVGHRVRNCRVGR
jgi:hypothetical protein